MKLIEHDINVWLMEHEWDWLESLVDDLDLANTTIERYGEISNLMEEIRVWQPKRN